MCRFNAVKKAVEAPERISKSYAQQPVKEAVDGFCRFVIQIDFDRRIFHGNKKYRLQAPEGFYILYQEFKEKWEKEISRAYYAIISLPLTEMGFTEKAPPHLETEHEFDPRFHDGAEALECLTATAENKMEEVYESGLPKDEQGRAYNVAKIGLEAYSYLTETIGLDPQKVYRRWMSIDLIFMPSHLLEGRGKEKGSLDALMDNAIDAYVFGAPAAAIAMCRAILESVLKDCYGLNMEDIKEPMCFSKFKFDQQDEKWEELRKRLLNHKKKANKIIHSSDRGCSVSGIKEGDILDFIKGLKFLIENAPKKPTELTRRQKGDTQN